MTRRRAPYRQARRDRRRAHRRLLRAGAEGRGPRSPRWLASGAVAANLEPPSRLGIVDRARRRSTPTGRASSPTPTSCCWPCRWRSFPRSSPPLPAACRRMRSLTDAGSTKQNVIAAARAAPGHGVAALRARASDRRHRAYRRGGRLRDAVSRPQRRADAARRDSDPAAVATRRGAVGGCGARVRTLDPAATRPHLRRRVAPAAPARVRARRPARGAAGCGRALPLCGERLSRFHPDRCQLAGNVAGHRARQPRRAPGARSTPIARELDRLPP